ncbi:bifunctional phosphoribosylaminoimidazole carboxylase/phosphoribosylaminoimidazole succinocarboxamide synthetase [Syngnathus scovelli]|uniref:bifunctional phosphoribosylaminoimidazole carboxylase/phosphoribosylaminoimidazole succinocarboxamide synthetase n=1 Tax=Syngnathus scovelli TaxID=161590 RepID=UPI00210F2DF0|nr:multifunctional protein ADE2 [Syngnathus scovelli]
MEEVGTQQRAIYPSSALEGVQVHQGPVGIDEGRHWTDEEVRALLCVWADRRVRESLKSTLHNKYIFQEISSQMQHTFGVVRNWKQCRTKYKNLKYDYKMAKSTHAARGGATSNPGKYMKFFHEVEAILLDHDLEEGSLGMQRSLGHGENAMAAGESEVVIEIDNGDNSDHYDPDADMDSKWRAAAGDPSTADQLQVVTVSDTGRNWSEQEVRALIQVWSDERVRRQLESSTRKRDVFTQISNRLMQQGIERDWKQCHTKYKNLKYLYRSLQKGKTDDADPKRLMRYYGEVDAIMNRKARGSDFRRTAMPRDDAHTASEAEEPICRSESVSPTRLALMPREEQGMKTRSSHHLDQWHPQGISLGCCESSLTHADSLSTGRGRKRKADDEDDLLTAVKKNEDSANVKDEQTHVPIFEVLSVCSMAYQDAPPEAQLYGALKINMTSAQELSIGQKLNEGKTKQIFEIVDQPGLVLVQSKDQITAGNAVRKDQMEGKAAIANKTTSCVFELLQEAGIKTAFVRKHSDTAFVAAHCEMIPIEWVCRRVATGSFLKRNPGVKEGYRFSPLKMEMFFKDDANNDPQWSEEQLLEAKFCLAGLAIGRCEVDIMNRSTVAIFEILEKAWATQNCTLVDMKIEFGVNVKTQEIVLADVIDNDSWRLWPAGDRSQQKDKQVYRDLKEVTPEAMQMVKRNFEWVSERVKLLLESQATSRVVVLMGSTSDMAHCEKIKKACESYGIPCVLRVTSAHKGPDETLRIKAEYEGDGVPTVFVAVAGRSNGLGPVMSGNTAYPVINCPPITPDWGSQDVWSSLRMPSGLGCSTILSPDAAARFAAQIFGLTNHLVWSKLRASMLNTWVALKVADKKLQACSL